MKLHSCRPHMKVQKEFSTSFDASYKTCFRDVNEIAVILSLVQDARGMQESWRGRHFCTP